MAYKENGRWRAAVKFNGTRKTRFLTDEKMLKFWEKETLEILKQNIEADSEQICSDTSVATDGPNLAGQLCRVPRWLFVD